MWADATASAFNYLAKEKVIPEFSLSKIVGNNATLSKIVRDEVRSVME